MNARFGPFVVDERSCSIRQGLVRLDVSAKAVELLVLLGRSGPRTARREELMERLWSGREVSDKALSMLVVELRRHLMPCLAGQDPIRTLPGVGYLLTMPYERWALPLDVVRGSGQTQGRVPVAVPAPMRLSCGARSERVAACWYDTLLNSLSAEPAIRVHARELSSIDEEADASLFVVRSSVRIAGRQVILSVRCVAPRTGEICWAGTEQAPASGSLEAEMRLCERVRAELNLAASECGETWRRYRQSSAFDLVAEGQRLVSLRGRPAIAAAHEKFQGALELDPGCAPALVGMADCEMLGMFYDGAREAGVTGRAMTYVQRALALNPELASAHSTHGFINLMQLRFENAEKDLLEAIRLDGSSATALSWYSEYLASQGCVDEAVQAAHLAVARAPRSVVVNAQLGQLLHMAGAVDDARVQLNKVLAMAPSCAGTHCFLALNLALQSDAAAMRHARLAVELAPDTPFYSGVLGSILAAFGARADALEQLRMLEQGATQNWARATAFAEAAMLVAASVGQSKRAIDWFRAATSNGAAWALCIPMLPMLAAIREEPAFQHLVRSRGMALSAS